MISRRKFLGSTTVGAAAATAAAAAPAHAFRVEEASEPVLEAYYSVCRPTGFHQRLLAEIEAALQGQEVPPDLAERLSAAEKGPCPLCGCPVGRIEDHETDPADSDAG